jgi:hypothetical protein
VLADRATDPYRTLTAGTQPDVQLVATTVIRSTGMQELMMGPWQSTETRFRSVRGWREDYARAIPHPPIRIPSGSKRLATAVRETLHVARLEAPSANSQS